MPNRTRRPLLLLAAALPCVLMACSTSVVGPPAMNIGGVQVIADKDSAECVQEAIGRAFDDANGRVDESFDHLLTGTAAEREMMLAMGLIARAVFDALFVDAKELGLERGVVVPQEVVSAEFIRPWYLLSTLIERPFVSSSGDLLTGRYSQRLQESIASEDVSSAIKKLGPGFLRYYSRLFKDEFIDRNGSALRFNSPSLKGIDIDDLSVSPEVTNKLVTVLFELLGDAIFRIPFYSQEIIAHEQARREFEESRRRAESLRNEHLWNQREAEESGVALWLTYVKRDPPSSVPSPPPPGRLWDASGNLLERQSGTEGPDIWLERIDFDIRHLETVIDDLHLAAGNELKVRSHKEFLGYLRQYREMNTAPAGLSSFEEGAVRARFACHGEKRERAIIADYLGEDPARSRRMVDGASPWSTRPGQGPGPGSAVYGYKAWVVLHVKIDGTVFYDDLTNYAPLIGRVTARLAREAEKGARSAVGTAIRQGSWAALNNESLAELSAALVATIAKKVTEALAYHLLLEVVTNPEVLREEFEVPMSGRVFNKRDLFEFLNEMDLD